MFDDSVWVSISIKKNLGNYESLGVEAGASKILGPDDNRKEMFLSLWEEVEAEITTQLEEAGFVDKVKALKR